MFNRFITQVADIVIFPGFGESLRVVGTYTLLVVANLFKRILQIKKSYG